MTVHVNIATCKHCDTLHRTLSRVSALYMSIVCVRSTVCAFFSYPWCNSRHPLCMETIADETDLVTYTAHCCFGSICNKNWERLGRFATRYEARREIVRHLMASSKHRMSEYSAMLTAQQYTVSGCDDCCVQEVYEGPLPGVDSRSSSSVRPSSRPSSGASQPRPLCAHLVPGALDIVCPFMSSTEPLMTETASKRSSQHGSDYIYVTAAYEGSLLGGVTGLSNSVQQLPPSRSMDSVARPSCAYMVPGALVIDSQGYPVRLTAQIAEEATILENALNAIDYVARHISNIGSGTTMADMPHLLAGLADMHLALKEHADQLRGVVGNLRSFEGTCRILAVDSQL